MTAHAHRIGQQAVAGRWLLVAIELVVALNASGGAIYGLAGAENVPRQWLEGTPFDSYVVPSLILLVAACSGMSAAAAGLLTQHRLGPEMSVVAGLLLICWITVQVIVIVPDGGFSWLQPAMFAAGAIVAVLGWQLRGVHRRPLVPGRNS